MYRAIEYFTDNQDAGHPYHVGDVFPRPGLEVSEERLTELLTSANRRHKPMIEKIEEVKPEAKPVKRGKNG